MTTMKLTKDDVQRIVNDPSAHMSQFDERQKANFIDVWETRLTMAISYHKRGDLQQLAESVLQFVKSRPVAAFRLYSYRQGGEGIGFLFDTETGDFFQII